MHVAVGAVAFIRGAARRLLSYMIAAWCLVALALPALAAGTRHMVDYLAGWAWDLAIQAAWQHLTGRLPAAAEGPLMHAATANVTIPFQPVAYLQEALTEYEEVQALGSAWTYAFMTLAAGRRLHKR